MRKPDPMPYTRVGHCCGPCNILADQALYKVGLIFRYRCAACYTLETGHKP